MKATMPIMSPAANAMTEMRNHRTPHSCGGPPTRREKAEASDSSTLRMMRSSCEAGWRDYRTVSDLICQVLATALLERTMISQTLYMQDMTPKKRTKNCSATPWAMNLGRVGSESEGAHQLRLNRGLNIEVSLLLTRTRR